MIEDSRPIIRSVQRPDEHYPQIQGILTIEVDRITKLDMMNITPYDSLSIVIRVRNVAKKTMQVRASIDGNAEWFEVKHIPVIIGLTAPNPTNRISFSLNRQPISNPIASDQIGYMSLHLHSIIRSSPGPRTFRIFNDNEVLVGRLSVRLIFHYGWFGFGHSPQISLSSSLSPDQYLMSSLMPRLRPPKLRFEAVHNTMKPRMVSHPHYIPFRSRAIFSRKKTATGEIEVHPHLASSLTRLEMMANSYLNISTRVQRLAYLASQFQGDTGEGDLAPPAKYTLTKGLAVRSTIDNVHDVVDEFVAKLETWLHARYNLKSQVKAVTKASQFLSRATTSATKTKESKARKWSVTSSKHRGPDGGNSTHSGTRGWAIITRTIANSMHQAWTWVRASSVWRRASSLLWSNGNESDTSSTGVATMAGQEHPNRTRQQPKDAWAGLVKDKKKVRGRHGITTIIPTSR